MNQPPLHLDLKKDRGLTIQWGDGASSYYSIAYLRHMSPSAEQREARENAQKNPLHILSTKSGGASGPLTALSAELVGNYALRVVFSDGHAAFFKGFFLLWTI